MMQLRWCLVVFMVSDLGRDNCLWIQHIYPCSVLASSKWLNRPNDWLFYKINQNTDTLTYQGLHMQQVALLWSNFLLTFFYLQLEVGYFSYKNESATFSPQPIRVDILCQSLLAVSMIFFNRTHGITLNTLISMHVTMQCLLYTLSFSSIVFVFI